MKKIDLIDKLKKWEGVSQEERAYLINLVNTKKKYGLVWEDKPEEVEEHLRENLPVLKEVKERAIVNGQEYPNHILIEGDNLHALTALSFTHESKIDVIYIDPPYNTGSKEDFIYNDHYVDKEDSFRHSKWLSFMQRRLKLAKVLLKEDGVIFCSIGDDEISQLTLLFNEVFTEANKLGVVTRVSKTAGDMGNYFAPSKDYIVVYTNNKSQLSNFKDAVDDNLFKKIETDGEKKGERYRDDVAFYQASQKDLRPNQKYFVDCPDGTKVIPPCSIQDEIMREGDGRWRWSKETYLLNRHLLVFKQTKKSPLVDEYGQQAKWNVYTKSYLNDRSEKGASPRDFLDQFINRKGADLIKLYDINFSFSKPFELIQHLIMITNKRNDIKVLDFFAGSGTALHSVMKMNEYDNGSRQCIIVTNNENNICEEVTYPRCERLINKYVNKKGQEMPYFPNNNLRFYRSKFVSRDPSIKNKKEITRLATELLCIREDIYTEQKQIGGYQLNATFARCFRQGQLNLLVIYDEGVIEQMVEVIQSVVTADTDRNTHFKVYVFSNGQYPYTEEFEEVLPYITLCALPDAIYKAYQNVLPKRQRQQVPELEESTAEDVETSLQDEANPNLFNQPR
jgi:adenine-specific DNA-methyltransferase